MSSNIDEHDQPPTRTDSQITDQDVVNISDSPAATSDVAQQASVVPTGCSLASSLSDVEPCSTKPETSPCSSLLKQVCQNVAGRSTPSPSQSPVSSPTKISSAGKSRTPEKWDSQVRRSPMRSPAFDKSKSKQIMAFRNPVAPMHSARSLENSPNVTPQPSPRSPVKKMSTLKVLGGTLKDGSYVAFPKSQQAKGSTPPRTTLDVSDSSCVENVSLTQEDTAPAVLYTSPTVQDLEDIERPVSAQSLPCSASSLDQAEGSGLQPPVVLRRPSKTSTSSSIERLSQMMSASCNIVRHSLRRALRTDSESPSISWSNLENEDDQERVHVRGSSPDIVVAVDASEVEGAESSGHDELDASVSDAQHLSCCQKLENCFSVLRRGVRRIFRTLFSGNTVAGSAESAV